MSVLRANVDYFWSIARPRDKKKYGYGGVWSKTDVNRTTDCSGIVTHTLDGVINGANMSWSRHGLSTEAYRYCGGNENDPKRAGARGPFGTVRVLRPGDIPADAAVKIGLMHGPGGGANSHMACTLEGVNVESSGSYGQRIGGPARGFNNSIFHDWFYLPGPIVGSGGTTAPATVPGAIYLGEEYENTGDRVLALQRQLNADVRIVPKLEEDGEFGPATAAAVRQYQQLEKLEIDGIAGPATLAALGLFTPAAPKPAVKAFPADYNTDELVKWLAEQAGSGHPDWPSKGVTERDMVFAIGKKLGAF